MMFSVNSPYESPNNSLFVNVCEGLLRFAKGSVAGKKVHARSLFREEMHLFDYSLSF